MEINHTKNLIPDIWEKRKAISVQEKNEHSQHVFDMSWLLLSTRNYTVSHCEAWHNNINYGEETEDLLNSAHQHLKFTFFIKQNTYEIITFRQRKLNPCILKENCCIETKDWINWIVRSTCLSEPNDRCLVYKDSLVINLHWFKRRSGSRLLDLFYLMKLEYLHYFKMD